MLLGRVDAGPEFTDYILYVSQMKAHLHWPSTGRTSGWVLQHQEKLQLQLSVKRASPLATPPASDIMLRLPLPSREGAVMLQQPG